MYTQSDTVVRREAGTREPLRVEVSLHQGSALNPFLFAFIMDCFTEKIIEEALWQMTFADDVLCAPEKEKLAEDLEK